MLHRKRIINCSVANAFYLAQAIQWSKGNLSTLFNKFKYWRFCL